MPTGFAILQICKMVKVVGITRGGTNQLAIQKARDHLPVLYNMKESKGKACRQAKQHWHDLLVDMQYRNRKAADRPARSWLRYIV